MGLMGCTDASAQDQPRRRYTDTRETELIELGERENHDVGRACSMISAWWWYRYHARESYKSPEGVAERREELAWARGVRNANRRETRDG